VINEEAELIKIKEIVKPEKLEKTRVRMLSDIYNKTESWVDQFTKKHKQMLSTKNHLFETDR